MELSEWPLFIFPLLGIILFLDWLMYSWLPIITLHKQYLLISCPLLSLWPKYSSQKIGLAEKFQWLIFLLTFFKFSPHFGSVPVLLNPGFMAWSQMHWLFFMSLAKTLLSPNLVLVNTRKYMNICICTVTMT